MGEVRHYAKWEGKWHMWTLADCEDGCQVEPEFEADPWPVVDADLPELRMSDLVELDDLDLEDEDESDG